MADIQYICVSGEAWGKGDTPDKAKANCKENHGNSKFYYGLYKCGPTAYVNDNGSLVYTPSKDFKPVQLEEVIA